MTGVLQYVGARYVPKFATPYEWDINATYEALTIVGYQGNSYTSKIPVPAGVQISDEKYWALTNSQSGAISALDERVTTLETEVMDATGDISALEADLATTNNTLSSQANSINRLQRELVFIPNKPAGLGNVVFIGDSYARVGSNWASQLIIRWSLSSGHYVLRSEESCGFAATGAYGNTFVTLLQTFASETSQDWRDNCTHIIILGGAYDHPQPTKTLENIGKFDEIARTSFKNASIYLACGARDLRAENILPCFNIAAYYQEGALKNNWHWCPNVNTALAAKSEIGGYLLPNSVGSIRLSEAMNSAVMTGNGAFNWPVHAITTSNQHYSEYIFNGNYFLHCTRNSTYTLDNPLSGTTNIDLPPLNSIYMSGPSQNLLGISTNIILADPTGNIETQVGHVTFNSTGIHIELPKTVNNVKTVYITPFILTVPFGLI